MTYREYVGRFFRARVTFINRLLLENFLRCVKFNRMDSIEEIIRIMNILVG